MSLRAMVASPALEPNEPFFSKGQCDECDTRLGGNRYDIIYREQLDGEVLEATVCEDCYITLMGG
ncbi:MAG: hypothetical protein WBC49_06060 [Thermoplasmata archaeon]